MRPYAFCVTVCILLFFAWGGAYALEVPQLKFLPGFSNIEDAKSLEELVVAVYNFFLAMVGLIAFVSLIIAGFKYLLSAANPALKKDARDQIWSVFLGFLLLIGSWLILNTINPELTILDPSKQLLPPIPVKPPPPQVNPPLPPSPTVTLFSDEDFGSKLERGPQGLIAEKNPSFPPIQVKSIQIFDPTCNGSLLFGNDSPLPGNGFPDCALFAALFEENNFFGNCAIFTQTYKKLEPTHLKFPSPTEREGSSFTASSAMLMYVAENKALVPDHDAVILYRHTNFNAKDQPDLPPKGFQEYHIDLVPAPTLPFPWPSFDNPWQRYGAVHIEMTGQYHSNTKTSSIYHTGNSINHLASGGLHSHDLGGTNAHHADNPGDDDWQHDATSAKVGGKVHAILFERDFPTLLGEIAEHPILNRTDLSTGFPGGAGRCEGLPSLTEKNPLLLNDPRGGAMYIFNKFIF